MLKNLYKISGKTDNILVEIIFGIIFRKTA